jgi:hypothetical protein
MHAAPSGDVPGGLHAAGAFPPTASHVVNAEAHAMRCAGVHVAPGAADSSAHRAVSTSRHVWVVPNAPLLNATGKHAAYCAQYADATAPQALSMDPSVAGASPALPASIVVLVSTVSLPPSDGPELSDGSVRVGAIPVVSHPAT